MPAKKVRRYTLLDRYHDLYVARHGVKPLIHGGKDGTILKRMVATWGEEQVTAMLEAFVNGNDPWARKQGWTIAAFQMVAPGMLTNRGVDGRTAENLEAARRATRRRSDDGI